TMAKRLDSISSTARISRSAEIGSMVNESATPIFPTSKSALSVIDCRNLAISIVPRNVECDKFNCIYSSTARTQHESFSRLTRSFMIAGAPLLANLIKKDDKCFFLCIIRILSWQQREQNLGA